MLNHPTLDILHALGLQGCAKGFKDLEADPATSALSHAEWLALLLEHEVTLRRQKRFDTRSARAKLRHAACVEDVDYRSPRGLDRALFLKLSGCQWIRDHRHTIICGATGLGKKLVDSAASSERFEGGGDRQPPD